MRLAEYLTRHIQKQQRLALIPPAIIEDVLEHGLQALADHVPMETKASEITAIDFDACEGCGNLIDPENPEGAVKGGEDAIWLCDACQVEGGGVKDEAPTEGSNG